MLSDMLRRMIRWLPVALALLVLAPTVLAPTVAIACPEVIVPLDPGDPAFRSTAWRKALNLYKRRRFGPALRALRAMDRRLRYQVEALFQPKDGARPSKNRRIQAWLQRHVYHKHPGVLIHDARFTYPALVWWALADTACRAGQYQDAQVALNRLHELRQGRGVDWHRAIVAFRLGRTREATALLHRLPPDSFLTPYLTGQLDRLAHRADWRAKLQRARKATELDDQRTAADRALAQP